MARVTDIKFSKVKPNTLVSTSYDGTIRAYDTKKYLNFRTMEPNPANKLMCVDLDDSGDVRNTPFPLKFHDFLGSI